MPLCHLVNKSPFFGWRLSSWSKKVSHPSGKETSSETNMYNSMNRKTSLLKAPCRTWEWVRWVVFGHRGSYFLAIVERTLFKRGLSTHSACVNVFEMKEKRKCVETVQQWLKCLRSSLWEAVQRYECHVVHSRPSTLPFLPLLITTKGYGAGLLSFSHNVVVAKTFYIKTTPNSPFEITSSGCKQYSNVWMISENSQRTSLTCKSSILNFWAPHNNDYQWRYY